MTYPMIEDEIDAYCPWTFEDISLYNLATEDDDDEIEPDIPGDR